MHNGQQQTVEKLFTMSWSSENNALWSGMKAFDQINVWLIDLASGHHIKNSLLRHV